MSRVMGLRASIEWIAWEDDPEVVDREAVAGTLTVALVADQFGKTADEIARRVVEKRLEVWADR